MRRYGVNKRSQRSTGQVAMEFALATVITAALGAMLVLFYQGFVRGNLYGGAAGGDVNAKRPGFTEIGISVSDKSMGLEHMVASPFP